MVLLDATIQEKTTVTENLALFKLITKEPIPKFDAGQFMMVGLSVNGKYQKRAYSIVSAPFQKDYMEFCIKAAPEGKVASHILKLEKGAQVKLEGPYGKFVLNGSEKDKLFIAAGTGIAPVLSMIRTLVDRGFTGKIRVFYGASYPLNLVYSDELALYAGKHGNLEFIPTVSRDAPEWTGERGRVEAILSRHIQGASNNEAYICGPPPMVQNSAEFLKSLGVAETDIHTEQYW